MSRRVVAYREMLLAERRRAHALDGSDPAFSLKLQLDDEIKLLEEYGVPTSEFEAQLLGRRMSGLYFAIQQLEGVDNV